MKKIKNSIINLFDFKQNFFKKMNHQKSIFMYYVIFLAILPMSARADVTETLNNFLGYLTGDVGKVVASLAIVGVGYGCMALGKISKQQAFYVALGIGLLFGTSSILTTLMGSTS